MIPTISVYQSTGDFKCPNPKYIGRERWESQYMWKKAILYKIEVTAYASIWVLVVYKKNYYGSYWTDIHRKAYTYEWTAKRGFRIARRKMANEEVM